MECDELLKIVGQRIRKVRKTLGVSQEKLAENANVHTTYISDIELAKSNASLCVYNAIAEALNLSLAELVAIPEQGDDELVGLLVEARDLDEGDRRVFVRGARGILLGIRER
jgi:transcriptional regulator with XRE-family HTH domain